MLDTAVISLLDSAIIIHVDLNHMSHATRKHVFGVCDQVPAQIRVGISKYDTIF